MQELLSTAKKVVGMTATLVNGYSSGLFYLLYRIARAACARMENHIGTAENSTQNTV